MSAREGQATGGHPRTCGDPACDRFYCQIGGEAHPGDAVQVVGTEPFQRGGLVDEAFVDEVAVDLQRRPRGAFGGAGLQQPEPTLLDGELEVLGVTKQNLEGAPNVLQLVRQSRKGIDEELRVGGDVAAGDDILALGVEEEVDIEAVRRRSPGSRVKATPDPEVTPMFPNTMACTVTAVPTRPVSPSRRRYSTARARGPGAQHRFDGAAELFHRVLGERVAGRRAVDVPEAPDDVAQGRDVELRDDGHVDLAHRLAEDVGERRRRAAVDHLGVRLDQSAVRVPHEHRVTGGSQQSRQRVVGQPDVENGLEHARHGYRRARPNGDEQGASASAEAPPADLLDPVNALPDRGVDLRGEPAILCVVLGAHAACRARNRGARPGWHRPCASGCRPWSRRIRD